MAVGREWRTFSGLSSTSVADWETDEDVDVEGEAVRS